MIDQHKWDWCQSSTCTFAQEAKLNDADVSSRRDTTATNVCWYLSHSIQFYTVHYHKLRICLTICTHNTSLTFDLGLGKTPRKKTCTGKQGRKPSGEQQRRIPLQDGQENRCHVTRWTALKKTSRLFFLRVDYIVQHDNLYSISGLYGCAERVANKSGQFCSRLVNRRH